MYILLLHSVLVLSLTVTASQTHTAGPHELLTSHVSLQEHGQSAGGVRNRRCSARGDYIPTPPPNLKKRTTSSRKMDLSSYFSHAPADVTSAGPEHARSKRKYPLCIIFGRQRNSLTSKDDKLDKR
jgi:hypothetical protein